MASTTTKATATGAIAAALLSAALLLPPNPNTIHITWKNPTTRVNGAVLPRSELRGVRIYVDGVQAAAIGGSRLDLQTYDLTLRCYKPGRKIDMTAVDVQGLEGPHSVSYSLPPKEGTTCK